MNRYEIKNIEIDEENVVWARLYENDNFIYHGLIEEVIDKLYDKINECLQ